MTDSAVTPEHDETSEAARIQRLIQSYELKVQDFAAETLRSSTLRAVVRRLYTTLAGVWREAGYSEGDALHFYRNGFPDDERDALLTALSDEERRWILEGTT